MKGNINALWLPVGSGTLATVFRAIVPLEIPIFAVNVHVLSGTDTRIKRIAGLANLTLVEAPQKFCERANHLPPVPSNIHYDAKLWELIQKRAQNRDVWWNVAR